ncbi:nuclear transport factor 2 family protein [Rhodococcus rhodochrous]|uniref:nuclear transport factor 2 family protein n=1 Tax=Rhodococcus rhodochrous TaxID=1829 RepID=UPI001E613F3F|nr:nuclear transport factor 2 family protein [Rhodococcus rhodochrous]MCB8913916.1 nuclear transport factor 2 family protein [Rhodococcus rhodochrous]
MSNDTNDITAVTQVVLRERQARDREWWEQMRECIHPDAHIRLSWFRGSGAQFVVESQKMSARGQQATHRLSPPVVSVHQNRAVVEISAGIEFRDTIGGVEADLTSYTRLLYRLQKMPDSWQIVSLDPIYERDSLIPTVPGLIPQIDTTTLAAIRKPYRFLGYYLRQNGYDITDDLYGDDRPDEVQDLYRSTFAWAADTTAITA